MPTSAAADGELLFAAVYAALVLAHAVASTYAIAIADHVHDPPFGSTQRFAALLPDGAGAEHAVVETPIVALPERLPAASTASTANEYDVPHVRLDAV